LTGQTLINRGYNMKNILILMIVFLSSVAGASEDMAEQFFSKKAVSLSDNAKKAIAISKKWQQGSKTSSAFYSDDGSVAFVYGSGQTQIVCAVTQLCDIALEPGETFTGPPHVGDPRFLVEKAESGEGETMQGHVVLKPLDVGLDTSLTIFTNKRTYHIRAMSTRNSSLPFVSFIYPESEKTKWAGKSKPVRQTQPSEGYIDIAKNINFNYTIEGDTEWKPERVYNDGVKTVIEMPRSVGNKSAPVFLVLKEEGGIFSEDKNALVNYSFVPADAKTGQSPKYIIDNLFNKGVLISGVGDSQEKVIITKGGV
jgi:type IV secretion system protein TrbG